MFSCIQLLENSSRFFMTPLDRATYKVLEFYLCMYLTPSFVVITLINTNKFVGVKNGNAKSGT